MSGLTCGQHPTPCRVAVWYQAAAHPCVRDGAHRGPHADAAGHTWIETDREERERAEDEAGRPAPAAPTDRARVEQALAEGLRRAVDKVGRAVGPVGER